MHILFASHAWPNLHFWAPHCSWRCCIVTLSRCASHSSPAHHATRTIPLSDSHTHTFRREYHQSFAQPGFAQTTQAPFLAILCLFSCAWGKKGRKNTRAQPWYARNSGNRPDSHTHTCTMLRVSKHDKRNEMRLLEVVAAGRCKERMLFAESDSEKEKGGLSEKERVYVCMWTTAPPKSLCFQKLEFKVSGLRLQT